MSIKDKQMAEMTKITQDYYSKKLIDSAFSGFYTFVERWETRWELKYLKIPIPTASRYYGNHEDWGLVGILISYKWIKTPIPIGIHKVKYPIFRKQRGKIKFQKNFDPGNDFFKQEYEK